MVFEMRNSAVMVKAKIVWNKTNRWHRGFLLLLAIETHFLPGGKVGFTCKDPALSYEFTGDTITAKNLFATIFLLPLAVLLVVEYIYNADSSTRRTQALKWYKEYVFGVLLNIVIVQALKLAVGSPRPHFFDTCGPEEAATCQESEYVTHYTCTKTQPLTAQSSRSFPSGHTSLAAYAGLFLVYYLHVRAKRTNAVFITQLLLSAIAVFCGVSRMIDHRHHWWDVLAGALLGLPVYAYTVYHLCENFIPRENNATTAIVESSDSLPLVDTKET